MSTPDKSALSLFSGAGGLDLGLKAAGWTVLAQLEMDHDAAETLRLHATDDTVPAQIIEQRIEDVHPAALRSDLGLGRGELALLAGGPPCQPFTTSGLRRGISDARAVSLFPAYLAYLDEFAPQSLILENVDGLLSAALRHRPLRYRGKEHPPLSMEEMKGSFLKWLLDELTSRGYSVSWGVAEAADYGTPQMRQRAVLLGVRDSDPCFLPLPTHGLMGQPPFVTLREALEPVVEIGPVQPLSAKKQAVYRMIPAGGNWRDLPQAVQQSTMGAAYHADGGKSGWWRRLSWDAPAPTVLGMPDHSSTALVHPDELRCLSVNECAAVQAFPSGTHFSGSPRSQYQQIGNAVPVTLGRALGEQISRFLDGERTAEPSPPEWRRASANRRVGTHGWAQPAETSAKYRLLSKVRDDHVWALTA